jgi:predicted Zn finger-like uncharacterized protein
MDMVIVVGGAVVILLLLIGVVVSSRNRRPPIGSHNATPRVPLPANSGDLICPACGTQFRPPDIMILTKADVRRYGRDPVQCPKCDHIWNAGRKIKRING